mmetsp:Transcript_111716/g.296929  ORF Transcript_111716/g.296929 Transcript_111716/m.296929 type:complete len:265 (+) Transcript_111716:242-1036(+)
METPARRWHTTSARFDRKALCRSSTRSPDSSTHSSADSSAGVCRADANSSLLSVSSFDPVQDAGPGLINSAREAHCCSSTNSAESPSGAWRVVSDCTSSACSACRMTASICLSPASVSMAVTLGSLSATGTSNSTSSDISPSSHCSETTMSTRVAPKIRSTPRMCPVPSAMESSRMVAGRQAQFEQCTLPSRTSSHQLCRLARKRLQSGLNSGMPSTTLRASCSLGIVWKNSTSDASERLSNMHRGCAKRTMGWSLGRPLRWRQ